MRSLRTRLIAGTLAGITVFLGAGGFAIYGIVRANLARDMDRSLVALARSTGAALGQDWVADAPAIVAFAGVYRRTARKYGERAPRYVHMEVGHAAQNVYLQATALGLGTTMVGAFRDDELVSALGLPGQTQPLGLLPVGRPR